jgi:hypothetical protein
MMTAIRFAKSKAGISRIGILDWLRRVNSREATRPALSCGMRSELVQTFRSDVDLLAGLVGRDLSAWLRTSEPEECDEDSGSRTG